MPWQPHGPTRRHGPYSLPARPPVNVNTSSPFHFGRQAVRPGWDRARHGYTPTELEEGEVASGKRGEDGQAKPSPLSDNDNNFHVNPDSRVDENPNSNKQGPLLSMVDKLTLQTVQNIGSQGPPSLSLCNIDEHDKRINIVTKLPGMQNAVGLRVKDQDALTTAYFQVRSLDSQSEEIGCILFTIPPKTDRHKVDDVPWSNLTRTAPTKKRVLPGTLSGNPLCVFANSPAAAPVPDKEALAEVKRLKKELETQRNGLRFYKEGRDKLMGQVQRHDVEKNQSLRLREELQKQLNQISARLQESQRAESTAKNDALLLEQQNLDVKMLEDKLRQETDELKEKLKQQTDKLKEQTEKLKEQTDKLLLENDKMKDDMSKAQEVSIQQAPVQPAPTPVSGDNKLFCFFDYMASSCREIKILDDDQFTLDTVKKMLVCLDDDGAERLLRFQKEGRLDAWFCFEEVDFLGQKAEEEIDCRIGCEQHDGDCYLIMVTLKGSDRLLRFLKP